MCYADMKHVASDRAFMGTTHALSGFSVLLAIVAFFPGFAEWAGFTTVAVVILAALVTTGFSLIPDLDNSASTAKGAFGLLGDALSFLFVNSAILIQTLIRTRRDDATPNPHRGFWHTIPAALLLGGLVLLATSIPGSITLPLYGEVTISWLVALLLAMLSIHLAFAGLFGKAIKKVKRSGGLFGDLAAFGLALVTAAVLFWFIPHDASFWWLGVAAALGVVIHILGDAFTTAGVPILFPLSYFIHKKFWWNTRFLPIKAGGPVENFVFMPLFALLGVAALVKVVMDYMPV